MKFALVGGQRQEAQPTLSGICASCGHPMIAKCGEVRISHWAHRKARLCDPWCENETEWHRSWKGQFPVDWQEVLHTAEDGEKHIADVRTNHGWVIEFQHSYIRPEERRSRDAFYKKLVWVVDATRRKTDKLKFFRSLKESVPVNGSKVKPVDLNRGLLNEWSACPAPIFFDFGAESILWRLFSRRIEEPSYISPFSRSQFIAILHGKGPESTRNFDEFTRTIESILAPYNARLRSQIATPAPALPSKFPLRRGPRRL